MESQQIVKKQRVGLRLGAAFGLLIAISVGIGYLGLSRMDQINAGLQEVLGRRWAKLQLAREALTYSNRNSRITMEVFLVQDRDQIDTLLARRAENTKKISVIVDQLGSQCESEEEKQLLALVQAKRTPYVSSYLRALHLVVEDGRREDASAVMLETTMPALFEYHAAWNAFLQYQSDQINHATRESRAQYARVRAVTLFLMALAVAIAVAIAGFMTRTMVREVKARLQTERANQQLHAQLEQRVADRTRELANANQELAKEIEERQRGEGRLRLQAAALAAAANSIVITDLQGSIVWVNPAFSRITGYLAEDVLGQNPRLLRSGQHPRAFYEELWRTITSGNVWHGEVANRRKDGSLYAGEMTITPVHSEGGEITHFIAIQQDITGRKVIEDALKQAEQKYRAIFEDAVVGIFQTTPEGRPLSVNRALAQMYGYESAAQLIAEAAETAPPLFADSSRWKEFAWVLKQGGVVRNAELELACKDGSKKWLLANVRALRGGNGRVVQHEGTVQDITERKLLEDQLRQSQKLEAVGRLAGGVAHDFNNALAVIIGYSELLQDRLDPANPLRSFTQEITKAGERAASLTRQLLAFSRKQILQPRVLDLNSIVTEIDKMLRRLIGEDIHLVVDRASNLGRVKADPGQLQQVLMNLAVNARDAMPQGGKLIIATANATLDESYVHHRPVVRPGAYVVLSVSDTGCGMDKATQARIFEPFFTTKEPGKGTGLGLSTVYGIVKQSGGFVWVYSEPGQGTTFKIYLPRVDQVPEASGAEPKPVLPGGSETILLVEDEGALRRLAQSCLQSGGYRVLEAEDGKTAVEIARRQTEPIHLLLTDVVMPAMSGVELAEQFASSWPETRLLYMSGYTDELIAQHGVLHTGTAILEKPFSRESLLRRVREVLDAKPSHPQAAVLT
ncbi:MAG: PAS domain S-box protein [Terriglobales bacterium]